MNFTPIWIVTFCAFVVSFLGIAILSKLLGKPIDFYNFSYKRVFPFEVLKHNEKPLLYKIFLSCFVATSFASIFNLLSNNGQLANLKGISIAISCIFGLSAICFVFLHYFDATHTKVHLFLFILFVCLTLLGNALSAIKGIEIYSIYMQHNQKMYAPLIGGIGCGVCSICETVIALNPNFRNWANLEKIDNNIIRPRKFVLAYSQWLTFLLFGLGEIFYFIILIIQ